MWQGFVMFTIAQGMVHLTAANQFVEFNISKKLIFSEEL